jgi:hypothetical protein
MRCFPIFAFDPFLNRKELAAMGKLVGLDADRLLATFPPKETLTFSYSTRLSGMSYAQVWCMKKD